MALNSAARFWLRLLVVPIGAGVGRLWARNPSRPVAEDSGTQDRDAAERVCEAWRRGAAFKLKVCASSPRRIRTRLTLGVVLPLALAVTHVGQRPAAQEVGPDAFEASLQEIQEALEATQWKKAA